MYIFVTPLWHCAKYRNHNSCYIAFRLCFFKNCGFLREIRTINTTRLCMIIYDWTLSILSLRIFRHILNIKNSHTNSFKFLTHIFCNVKQNKVSYKTGQFLKISKVRNPTFCIPECEQKLKWNVRMCTKWNCLFWNNLMLSTNAIRMPFALRFAV